MKSAYLLILLIIVTSLSFSCSNGALTSPQIDEQNLNKGSTPIDVIVSERSHDGNPISGFGFMGLYSVKVNIDSLTGDISPIRKNALEDVLEVVDITNFLTLAPCVNCAKIKSIELDADGHAVLSIGIRHPFDVGDPLKPITGRNRADLHVFNVEGIVVSDSAEMVIFPNLHETSADARLLNADGATDYLDPSLDTIFPTESSVHPYRLHFDDFSEGNYNPSYPMGFESVTTPPPSGHLVMPMGCDYDYEDYVFDIKNSDSIEFIYAIGCTYAVSAASKSLRFTPEYRLPQHNKKAATTVGVEIVTNNLFAGDISSTAELEIKVVDVNHGIPVGTALNEMRADSSVSKIDVEIPGVMLSVLNVPLNPLSGDGLTPATALVYSATITNTAGGDIGDYVGLVKVTDSCPTGLNASPLLNGLDGIKRVGPLENPLTGLFGIDEFATYAIFRIPITLSNLPPIANLAPPSVQIAQGNTVLWDASASTDPDGTIVLYEWDYVLEDGDPLNFNTDASGIDATKMSDPYNDLDNWVAAVRVTDNEGATDIATSDVEVLEAQKELILDAMRSSYNPTFNGGITKAHLDWDDMPGAVEYAVYRSHLYADPYSWVLIGTTIPPVSEFDDINLQTVNYIEWIDHKYIYEVRPRSIVGDPNSEGLPSQRALIFMESNDCDPITFGHAPYDPEQPNFLWRYGAGGDFGPVYSGNWRCDEPTAPPWWYVNITVWNEPSSSWEVFYTGLPIPDIADQSMAYFDFAYSNGPYYTPNSNIGFAPGTFTTPPATDGLPDFFDFDPAPASDYLLGEQYKSSFNSLAFQNFFGEPPGTLALHNPYYPFYMSRYKITRLLQPDVDYAAIGIASWQYTSGSVVYHMWESIAIVVY